MSGGQPQDLVLAVYPFSRGFAFVFFEGPESPFEWGVRELKDTHKNTRVLAEIKKLIDRYRPAVIVIENTDEKRSRRNTRIRKLYRMIRHLAAVEYVDVFRYTKSHIKACFSSVGASTKYDIAKAIAIQIPGFGHRMPPMRKPWVSEDPRQSLFDAAALGLTYYCRSVLSPYTGDIYS